MTITRAPKEIFLFLDDVVIYGETIAEYNEKFERFLQRLRQANLKLQTDKCEFFKTDVVYLGHVLSEEGEKPDPCKLVAVREFSQPKNIKNIYIWERPAETGHRARAVPFSRKRRSV